MPEKAVILGQINGLFGIKGWVKVYSYTRPKENILGYQQWRLNGQDVTLEDGHPQGKGIVAKIRGYDDRNAAANLVGAEISVPRDVLPAMDEDEYYWADLYNLRVINLQDVELGRIERLLETGANDVLVVKNGRERLIPLVFDRVVLEVNLEQGLMRVDWDKDF